MTDELGRLLDALGRDLDERIAICHQDAGDLFTVELTTVKKAPFVAANYAATNCWYSTQPIHERVTNGRGRECDVIGLRELPADLDVKPGGMPDYDAANNVISDLSEMLGATPVAAVRSGHGLQPHWHVERGPGTDWADDTDPWWADGKALLRRWGRLVAKVAASHNGHVDNIYDLSRVLRAPGTVNRKGEPVPVTVEFCGGAPVTLEQIRDTLGAYGIPELPEDRERLGETVAPAADWAYGQTTCRYVAAMVEGWTDDTPEARHPWLISRATRLAAAHRGGCITEADHAEAVRALTARFRVLIRMSPAREEHPNEIGEALGWGVKRVETKADEQVRCELGNHRHPGETPTIEVDGFWDARPELAHIREFARARRVSPWATLLVVLARVITAVPPRWQLPGLIGGRTSLNLFGALVGPSGSGKDAAITAGRDAVNVGEVAERTPGSGEGIAHCFVIRNKKGEIEQNTPAVLFVASEIDVLTQLAKRQGSTLGPVLRVAFNGERLGFAYVDPAKNLEVKAHTYRLALLVGVQPERAAPLLDEATSGTPQRFLWMPATDPDAPDERPDEPPPISWTNPTWTPSGAFSDPDGPQEIRVCETAREVIDQGWLGRARGKGDALDGHALLTRLKVATGLGLFNGRVSVNDEDWQLAGQLMQVSNTTRRVCIDAVDAKHSTENRARAHAEAERAEVVDDRRDERRIQRVAGRLVKKLTVQGDWMPRKPLRNSLASADRPLFDEAIGLTVKVGQVEVEDVTYQGQAGQRYRIVR